MMSTVQHIVAILIGLCLSTVLAATPEGCNRKLCPGPLYYYEELGCSPVFDSADSCCPVEYNCDNWKNLPEDKCLVNGRVYETNERLPKSELADPCLSCTCYGNFACSISSCAGPSRKENCNYTSSLFQCCRSVEICPDTPVTCIVDGKPYRTGERFNPLAEPEKTCVCTEKYAGVNSKEFCVWKKPSWCDNVVMESRFIRKQCAPIYRIDRSLQTDCNDHFVCPDHGDFIINRSGGNYRETTVDGQKDAEKHCVFGNSTIRRGEELRGSQFGRSPVRCVCEVPPVPTCRYLK